MTLTFNINFDTDTNNAPSGFIKGLAHAIEFYRNNLETTATLNITVKWENLNPATLTAGDSIPLAESRPVWHPVSYSRVCTQ
jgi:hypothetical protein